MENKNRLREGRRGERKAERDRQRGRGKIWRTGQMRERGKHKVPVNHGLLAILNVSLTAGTFYTQGLIFIKTNRFHFPDFVFV